MVFKNKARNRFFKRTEADNPPNESPPVIPKESQNILPTVPIMASDAFTGIEQCKKEKCSEPTTEGGDMLKEGGGSKPKVMSQTTTIKKEFEAPPEREENHAEATVQKFPLTQEVKTKLEAVLKGEAEYPEIFSQWEIQITRISPQYENDVMLKTSQIRTIRGVISYAEVQDMIEQEYGGGNYRILVQDQQKIIRAHVRQTIDGRPKVTPDDIKFHREKLGEYPETEKRNGKNDDEIEKLRRDVEIAQARLDKEEKEYEIDQKRKTLQEKRRQSEDNERQKTMFEDNPEPQQNTIPQYDPAQMQRDMYAQARADISAEIEQKNKEKEISDLKEEMKSLKNLLLNPPAAPKKDIDVEVLVAAVVGKVMEQQGNPLDKALQIVQVLNANKPAPSGESESQKMSMNLMVEQMKAGNAMMIANMQQVMSLQGEIMREAVKNAMAAPGGEGPDFKQSLLATATDIGKTLISGVVDVNREKAEIEKKKLDLIGQGKMIPRQQMQQIPMRPTPPPMRPTPTVRRPAPVPPMPQQAYTPPARPAPQAQSYIPPLKPKETPEQAVIAAAAENQVDPERIKAAIENAKAVLNAAQDAITKGSSPVFFAHQSMRIASPDVQSMLIGLNGVEDLRNQINEISEADGKLFELFVMGNVKTRDWVTQWLNAIKANYYIGEELAEEQTEETEGEIEESDIIQSNISPYIPPVQQEIPKLVPIDPSKVQVTFEEKKPD